MTLVRRSPEDLRQGVVKSRDFGLNSSHKGHANTLDLQRAPLFLHLTHTKMYKGRIEKVSWRSKSFLQILHGDTEARTMHATRLATRLAATPAPRRRPFIKLKDSRSWRRHAFCASKLRCRTPSLVVLKDAKRITARQIYIYIYIYISTYYNVIIYVYTHKVLIIIDTIINVNIKK